MDFSTAASTPLSLADFFHGESDDPLAPPKGFRQWREDTAWAASLYEQELLGSPSPHVRIVVEGIAQPVINLNSYNYLGLATHPEVIAAAQQALVE